MDPTEKLTLQKVEASLADGLDSIRRMIAKDDATPKNYLYPDSMSFVAFMHALRDEEIDQQTRLINILNTERRECTLTARTVGELRAVKDSQYRRMPGMGPLCIRILKDVLLRQTR